MLKSMTAYSRSILVVPLGRFVVELQSVNRKFLEINTFLPKLLIRFDGAIKKWIGEKVLRGQVNVRLSVAFNQGTSSIVVPNLPLVIQLKSAWDQIADALEIPAGQFSLSLLAEEEGILTHEDEIQDEELIKDALKSLFLQALDQLLQMKLREGEALQSDILQRLDKLKAAIGRITEKAPDAVQKYKEKLLLKMQEVLKAVSVNENDERLMKEICLFADKVDIAEEITRFNSHLAQFNEMINSQQEGLGKTLEFLVQELNREINTIGSKSADVEIARLVIDVKAELERIREQIQNVE